MGVIKKALFACALVCLCQTANAQFQDSDNYESEFIWGINKNTAGGLIGGFVFRKSKRLTDNMYQSLGLEVVNLKHSQETQRRSQTGNTFIFGKNHYLYALRFQYGRELILFRKAPQQGVEIKAIGAIGPSIGLHAPYYIEYNRDCPPTSVVFNTVREQYDPARHTNINCFAGTGHLFQGIHESDLVIGANAKAAISFELGTSKSHVTGFEAGFLLDAYTSEVELMPRADNKGVFPTAFITLFYGTRR